MEQGVASGPEIQDYAVLVAARETGEVGRLFLCANDQHGVDDPAHDGVVPPVRANTRDWRRSDYD